MHLAIPPVFFLLVAAEMTVFGTCTVCDFVEAVAPVSLDIDDLDDETVCPGEELVRVPGTLDCELVLR